MWIYIFPCGQPDFFLMMFTFFSSFSLQVLRHCLNNLFLLVLDPKYNFLYWVSLSFQGPYFSTCDIYVNIYVTYIYVIMTIYIIIINLEFHFECMCIYVHACMNMHVWTYMHIFPILVHFIFSKNICFLYVEICMIVFLSFTYT